MSAAPRVLFVGRTRYTLPLARLAREEVGRRRGASSTTASRRRGEPSSAPSRRALPARAARAPARARRRSLFYLRLPFRVRQRDQEFEPDVDRRRRSRSSAPPRSLGRRLAGSRTPRDRRGARRLADVHAALRLARAAARRPAAGRPARRVGACGAPTRRAPSRPSRRSSSRRRAASRPTATFTDVQRPLRVHGAAGRSRCPSARRSSSSARSSAYKNVDGLAAAWRRLADRAARGAARDRRPGLAAATWSTQLVRDFPGRVEHHAGLDPDDVAAGDRRGDACSCCRRGRRASAASSSRRSRAGAASSRRTAGGIPDLVDDGGRGPPRSRRPTPTRSSQALERVLADRELAARLGAAARGALRGLALDARTSFARADARPRRAHGRRHGR